MATLPYEWQIGWRFLRGRRRAGRRNGFVSFIAGVALGQISGFGPTGYLLALDALAAHLEAGGKASRPRTASKNKPTASRR
jgi:hypothetical protein